MNSAELREQLTNGFMEDVRQTKYPSITMLDEIEGALETREQIAEYAEVLVEKVGDTPYPGISLLNRVNGVLIRLEQMEQYEQALERSRSSDDASSG